MSNEYPLAHEAIHEGTSEMTERSFEYKNLLAKIAKRIESNGGADQFFSEASYEDRDAFENDVHALSFFAHEALVAQQPEEVIEISRNLLELSGVMSAREVSVQSPSSAVAIAEAVNFAAKAIHYAFYALKPVTIVAAAKTPGVEFGYGSDDAYYLGTHDIGVASFHDPGDEVGRIFLYDLKEEVPLWTDSWSGVERQHDAFHILDDLCANRGLASAYAESTGTQDMRGMREAYLRANMQKRLATIGDVFPKIEKA